ncbi:MAG: HlyC/CorC family transporter [Clostridia bacterium]|nr:HlyC/CorC family transporter [Clostridia bacterium]
MSYVLIVVFICFSAFFSGTEIAYTSVNRVRLRKMAESGDKLATLAVRLSDKFEESLTAILVGNNFVNIGASSVSATIAMGIAANMEGAAAQSLMVTIATVIITILILIFGEIVPKVVCKQNSELMVRICAYPLAVVTIVFSPITFIVAQIMKLGTMIWGTSDDTVTEEELATIIETAEEDGGIDEEKSELLQSALEFSDISLDEIFTHRKDVVALDVDDSTEENLRRINASRYSRLPVYKDSIDNIVGILNINHYYKKYASDRNTTVKDVMLEPTYMHSTVKLPVALEEMRKRQIQLVVVLDEYGGTRGIVTMEDILEQIVGDIWDESDEIVVELKENEDGTYQVLGEMNVYDMFDELDIDDRDFESDCNTVGGWCVEVLEQNPGVGMCFDYKNLHVEITKVEDEIRVIEVCITVNELPEAEDEEE